MRIRIRKRVDGDLDVRVMPSKRGERHGARTRTVKVEDLKKVIAEEVEKVLPEQPASSGIM